jgi:hypothetical protein
MRIVWLMGWLMVASACSSHGIRCGKHLHPINIPSAVTVPGKPSGHP